MSLIAMILLTICVTFIIFLTSKYLKRNILLKVKRIFEELLLAIVGFLSLIFLLKKNFFNIIDNNKTTNSIVTLYILWISGLYSSRIASTFKLAPLLGSLLSGIILRNISTFEYFIVDDKAVTDLICDIGFIIILIRSGIALNIDVLKKYFAVCLLIGMFPTIFDIISIVGLCNNILNFPFRISFLFSLILSCTAPAIIVPVMVELKKEKKYESKGIITIILASATFINIVCITSFSIFLSVCFENELSYVKIQKTICLGVFFGIIFGTLSSFVMINMFKNFEGTCHFKKALTIMTYCLLMYFGGKYFENNIIGSVGIILFTLIINCKFNKSDEQSLNKEDEIFKYGWNNLIEPILFSSIGTMVKIKEMNINVVLIALVITIISTIMKWAALLLISKFTHLNCKESIYIAFSFTSKATVQAALAPKLAMLIVQKNLPLETSLGYPIDKIIIVIAIISIILSAPLGHALITYFPHLISGKNIEPNENLSRITETDEVQTFIQETI